MTQSPASGVTRSLKDLKEHPLNTEIYGVEIPGADLVESIRTNGVLEPIVINEDNKIISGHRRWLAAREANLEEVPCRVLPFPNPMEEEAALIEFNRQREKTLTQKMRESEHLVAIESKRAKERQATSTGGPSPQLVPTLAPAEKAGKTRDAVANKIGMKPSTFIKAIDIWEKVKKGDEIAKKLFVDMDAGRKTVHAAYTEIRRTEELKKKVKPAPPIPGGNFDVILADPPWEYEHSTPGRKVENHYPTMELATIKALKVPAADNAVLLLWATAPKVEEALQVMNAWGFRYRTCAVWDKGSKGMGYWFRIQHELLLVGVKGSFSTPAAENRVDSIIRSPVQGHSQKPASVQAMIEKMFPGRTYLELFARSLQPGWTSWGNEVPSPDPVPVLQKPDTVEEKLKKNPSLGKLPGEPGREGKPAVYVKPLPITDAEKKAEEEERKYYKKPTIADEPEPVAVALQEVR